MADENVRIPKPSISEVELRQLEADKLRSEAEFRALEIEAKKLELSDLRDRIEERKMKKENKDLRGKTNGITLRQLEAKQAQDEANCNHKKGGNGLDGVVGGRGDDSQFAVMKHIMPNGDMWIRCLRCGKTWKPVERTWFPAGAEGDATYTRIMHEYRDACAFQTRNQTSSSMQYRYSDGGKYFREVTRNTNLR